MADAPVTLMTPRVLLPFILITAIWGSTYFIVHGQLGVVPPIWSVVYRFVIASMAMAVLAFWQHRTLRLSPRGHMMALAIGVMQFALNYNFAYASQQYLTSGLLSILFALLIIPNSVFGRWFLGTPLRRNFIIGASIAVIGVGLMITHEVQSAALPAPVILRGALLGGLAVFFASLTNVLQGGELARAQPMAVMLAWAMAWGALMDMPYAWWQYGPPVFDPRAAYWAGLLWLAIAGSVVTFPLYFNIIREVGPGPAAWSGVLIPIVAMTLSTLFEGYRWATLSVAGAALVLVGLVVAIRPPKPAQGAAAE